MSAVATQGKAARVLTLDGKSYRWHPLNMGSLTSLEDWARGQLPDPFEAIRGKLDGFSVDERKFLLQAASDRAARRPTLASPEVAEVLMSMAGFGEMFYLGVAQGDPAFARKDAEAVCRAVGLEAIQELIEGPKGTDVEAGDPKA